MYNRTGGLIECCLAKAVKADNEADSIPQPYTNERGKTHVYVGYTSRPSILNQFVSNNNRTPVAVLNPGHAP